MQKTVRNKKNFLKKKNKKLREYMKKYYLADKK